MTSACSHLQAASDHLRAGKFIDVDCVAPWNWLVEAVAEHTGGCCMWCCTGTLPVEWADMEGMENIWLDGNKLSGDGKKVLG
jgi:hypothetical protein